MTNIVTFAVQTAVMRKIVLTICLMLFCLCLGAQAKRPIIMVIPSDAFCVRNGYYTETIDPDGRTNRVPDYKTAFQSNEQLRLVVSELSTIMADRSFPLKDMEQTIRKMETQQIGVGKFVGRSEGVIELSEYDRIKMTARADILMDVDFTIHKDGAKQYISFNIKGVDAYKAKVVAAASGDGTPSLSASAGLLIEEAVIGCMDGFNDALMAHFEDMFDRGREVTMSVFLSDNAALNLEEAYYFKGERVRLSDGLDWWMSEHCVGEAFSRSGSGMSYIDYEQVRIPLFKTVLGKERAIDTRYFATELARFLEGEPFGIPTQVDEIGLGHANIIIGE